MKQCEMNLLLFQAIVINISENFYVALEKRYGRCSYHNLMDITFEHVKNVHQSNYTQLSLNTLKCTNKNFSQ